MKNATVCVNESGFLMQADIRKSRFWSCGVEICSNLLNWIYANRDALNSSTKKKCFTAYFTKSFLPGGHSLRKKGDIAIVMASYGYTCFIVTLVVLF